MKRLIYIVNLK